MKGYIVLLLTGSLYAAISCYGNILGRHAVLPGPPAFNVEDIKHRMEYHGALVVWHDEHGQWAFHRNGQVCNLHERQEIRTNETKHNHMLE